MIGHHKRPDELKPWMTNAFQACIDAQLVIENPYWDEQTRHPKLGTHDDYIVEFYQNPKVSVYYITVSQTTSHGGLLLLCRLDNEAHTVLYTAYYLGDDPGFSLSKEANLGDHDPLGGITEAELDLILDESEMRTFPLTAFLGNGL